mgnify:CR=1 FL=1
MREHNDTSDFFKWSGMMINGFNVDVAANQIITCGFDTPGNMYILDINAGFYNPYKKALNVLSTYEKFKPLSFGIEKAGSRGSNVLAYFIFRTTNLTELKKLFLDNFKDYNNALKITCSVAEYQKINETFFEVDLI